MRNSDAIRLIKERISIVDLVSRFVNLKVNGGRFTAPCPFHQETKPSFSVNPDKGFFYCFGCQATGDIFEFYSKINGIDFRESLEQLAYEAGVSLDDNYSDFAKDSKKSQSKRKIMLEMHELAAKHFITSLNGKNGADCRKYIEERGISRQIVEQFGLGWAEREWNSLTTILRKEGYDLDLACEAGLVSKSDRGTYYDRFRGRLMFPIKDNSNHIIAFGGRILHKDEGDKYINSSDTPIYKKKEHLYGLFQAKRGITDKGYALLTEGYIDVISMHQYGCVNGVGVLGTALTPEQIKRLSCLTSHITLIFDGDRAGRKASLRSCEMLLSYGLACRVVSLPEGEDIDSLLRSQGRQEFDILQENAKDGLQFCIDIKKNLAPREAIDWAKGFLRNIQIPELISQYVSIIALNLKISEDILRESLTVPKVTLEGPKLQKLCNILDSQILIFLVRYPERLADLRDIGADLALSTPRAKELWDLIEKWGSDDAFYHLDEKQKSFWEKYRGPGSAPLISSDKELDCLKRELQSFYSSLQQLSLSAALAAKKSDSDFALDMEYLRALQETMEKRREQS